MFQDGSKEAISPPTPSARLRPRRIARNRRPARTASSPHRRRCTRPVRLAERRTLPPTPRLLGRTTRPRTAYNGPLHNGARPTSPCGDDATSDRRWLVPGEVRHDSTADDRRRGSFESDDARPAASPAESTRERCWPHSLPLQRFHVLFNSLFKVLFIFPSRYFFAIGLVPVFSFRWSLPPALGCIPKQPDSWKVPRGARTAAGHGILTLCDVPFQATWTADRRADSTSRDYNSPTRGRRLTA